MPVYDIHAQSGKVMVHKTRLGKQRVKKAKKLTYNKGVDPEAKAKPESKVVKKAVKAVPEVLTIQEKHERAREKRKTYRETRKAEMDAQKQLLISKLFVKLLKEKVITKGVLEYHTTDPEEWPRTKKFLFTGGSNLREANAQKEDTIEKEQDKAERKLFKFSGASYLLDTDREWANLYTQIEEPYTRRTLTEDTVDTKVDVEA